MEISDIILEHQHPQQSIEKIAGGLEL